MKGNPYVKTNWLDHIVDVEEGEVIQEGTRFTATRANNIEDGIYNSHEQLLKYKDEISKLSIQLEMIGRVPVNNGTFFDPINADGSTKALRLLNEATPIQTELVSGTETIQVEKGDKFKVGQQVTILDEEYHEDTVITGIIENTLTVSPLINNYKKGSLAFRSNVKILENRLAYGTWGNYTVEVR